MNAPDLRARLAALRREARSLEAMLTSSPAKRGRAALLRALETSNMHVKFTPELIKSLTDYAPTDRHEAFLRDTEVKGWVIRVLRSGTASWCTECTVRGQPKGRRKTFGSVHRLPFTLARERAKTILAQADLGIDWHAEQKALRAAEQAASQPAVDVTLGALLRQYLTDPKVRQRRTVAAAERYLLRTWQPLHERDPETLHPREIIAQLERITLAHGPVAALRARSRLLTAFRWLVRSHRIVRRDNPVAEASEWLGKPGEDAGKRDRTPSLKELAAIWRACAGLWPQTFGAATRLLLLLGCRKSEVALLKWSEVDLDKAVLSLPKERVKTNKPHVVPLSRAAVRILRELPERRSARVFPVISWSRCKAKLDEISGVRAYTLHDFRRSLSTLARERELADGEVIERQLGHIEGGVKARYDHSKLLDRRRELVERWSALILREAGEPTEQPALRVVEGGGR